MPTLPMPQALMTNASLDALLAYFAVAHSPSMPFLDPPKPKRLILRQAFLGLQSRSMEAAALLDWCAMHDRYPLIDHLVPTDPGDDPTIIGSWRDDAIASATSAFIIGPVQPTIADLFGLLTDNSARSEADLAVWLTEFDASIPGRGRIHFEDPKACSVWLAVRSAADARLSPDPRPYVEAAGAYADPRWNAAARARGRSNARARMGLRQRLLAGRTA